MCGENAGWRFHWYFMKVRKQEHLSAVSSFRPHPRRSCCFTNSPSGLKGTFCQNEKICCCCTLFLNSVANYGIFIWTVQVANRSGWKNVTLGVAPSAHLDLCDVNALGTYGSGSCGFLFSVDNNLYLHGVRKIDGYLPFCKVDVLDGSLVTLEADARARTISLFVEGRKVPVAASDILLPFQMGISGCSGASFTSLCFRRVDSPTPSTVECQYHNCIQECWSNKWPNSYKAQLSNEKK